MPERRTRQRRPPPRRAGQLQMTGERRRREPSRRVFVTRRVLAVGALVLAAVLIWFLLDLFQPFTGAGHGRVEVTIPANAGTGQIAQILERDGVIDSSFFFKLRAMLEGDRDKLRSGHYRLALGMSYATVLRILTTPPPPAKTTEVTTIPGKARSQIDALLRSQGVRGSYVADSRHSSLLNPAAYGAPKNTPDLEGFLFPDTYQLKDPLNLKLLVDDQLREFKQQFARVNMRYARSKNLTPYDVLKIASMVEAEAATARDRPLVAAVIYNRLRLGMPLGLDATTRYATGNYLTPLTDAQLNSSSPYNTRLRVGLPPTPIDSPSLAAIQAAAHPAHSGVLYFVVKPCGNGEMTFTSSYAQFQADANAYQQARQRLGHSPEFCKKK
jgi:uncharacterized YceG family protein